MEGSTPNAGSPGPSAAPSGGNILGQIEHFLDLYLGQKAPQIPAIWRERLVTVIPWISLIIFVLTLPTILFLLGIGAAFLPAAMVYGHSAGIGFTISMILLGLSLLLQLLSLPGLFKRTHAGWRFAYFAELVSILSSIIYFSIGGIIGSIVGLWILFQIKSYYK